MIPEITIKVPIICNTVIFSSKKMLARIIVEIGPILPKIEKSGAPIFFIVQETRYEGITVDKNAIAKPSQYTF